MNVIEGKALFHVVTSSGSLRRNSSRLVRNPSFCTENVGKFQEEKEEEQEEEEEEEKGRRRRGGGRSLISSIGMYCD